MNPDAVQTCERWLVPINDRWVASPTGKRRHYAPNSGLYSSLARCGTGVSVIVDQQLRRRGVQQQLLPCQRCIDIMAARAEQERFYIDFPAMKAQVRQALQLGVRRIV